MMKKTVLCFCVLAGITHSFGAFAASFESEIKPFPFAARPAEGTAADCSYMNTPITEEQRITVGDDGHLYAAGKRLRIFGTNLSSFPPVEDAEYWAKTIAAQGYNCIRFHHTDSDWAECFFMHDKAWKTATFDEKSFERFDKFFYELKKAGVYSNINLLTGRTIRPDEQNGLPQELNKVADWKDQHCYGFWNELAREDQRKYAEKILNHKNPYTGLTYAEDPAVAFVEINNENSMTKGYLDGAISRFPSSLTQELDVKWTAFLKERGWDYNKLDKAFNQKVEEGENLLSGKTYLEQHSGAKATLEKDGSNSIIKVTQNGTENWHVQYDYYGFTTESEQLYTISFKVKASKECSVNVDVMMDHDPWTNLGFSKEIKLNKKWQEFSYSLSSLQTDSKPRLTFGNMGRSAGTTIEISDVKLCKGGNTVNIEKSKAVARGTETGSASTSAGELIKFPASDTYRALPLNLRLLVTEFLVALDDDYWGSMNDYLKKDLKIKSLTFGTALPCAPVTVMSKFDVVDTHAYWHHPSFPGSSWNTKDYFVKNQSLVTADDGGTLSSLAKLRIYGKPFSVTEYDHPYPSQFSSEMMPMLAVFASLQDWDCVYSFCYEISQRNPDKVKITGYFDQGNNPSKIAGVPVAARIFREFRIKPFEKAAYYKVTPQAELNAIAKKGSAWNVAPPEYFDTIDDKRTVEGVNVDVLEKAGFLQEVSIGMKSLEKLVGGIIFDDDGVSGLKKVAAGAEVGATGTKAATGSSANSNRVFTWNSSDGYFIYSDEDVFVSVTTPNAKPQERAYKTKAGPDGVYTSEMRFIPQKDFASVAAVKLDDSRWFIFSSSWCGNEDEKLFEYGKKPKAFPKYAKTRSVANITTEFSGSGTIAVALGSNGTIKIPEQDKGWKLYPLKADGTRTKRTIKASKAAKGFVLSEADNTLWYELKK